MVEGHSKGKLSNLWPGNKDNERAGSEGNREQILSPKSQFHDVFPLTRPYLLNFMTS